MEVCVPLLRHCTVFNNSYTIVCKRFLSYNRRQHEKIQYPEKSLYPKKHLYSPEEHKAYSKAMAYLKSKKRRDVSVFVENRKMIYDMISQGQKPSHIFYVQEKVLQILPSLPEATVTINVTERQMSGLTDVAKDQGILAVFDRPSILPGSRESIPLIVYLDSVKDPGNAGTIVRSAAAAACTSVVTSNNAVNLWRPAPLRASAAAHFLIPIYQKIDFEDVLNNLPPDWTICFVESHGCSLPSNCPSVPYYQADFTVPTLMVFGNEASGVNKELRNSVSETHNIINTFIPTIPQLDSLNVGMAATVLIFEMAKQQRQILKMSAEDTDILLKGFSSPDHETDETDPPNSSSDVLPKSDVIEDLEQLFPPPKIEEIVADS